MRQSTLAGQQQSAAVDRVHKSTVNIFNHVQKINASERTGRPPSDHGPALNRKQKEENEEEEKMQLLK